MLLKDCPKEGVRGDKWSELRLRRLEIVVKDRVGGERNDVIGAPWLSTVEATNMIELMLRELNHVPSERGK